MRKLIVAVLAAGSLLAAPTAALAGGWATVGISPSSPPAGSGPGDTWVTEVTVLQHGMTPLADVKPVLILTNQKTGETLRFPAKPTKETGVYSVSVELPAKGSYDLQVYDGFVRYGGAQTHTFAPIALGPAGTPVPPEARPTAAAAPVADETSTSVWPLALGALAAALAAAVFVLARRSRKKAPAVA